LYFEAWAAKQKIFEELLKKYEDSFEILPWLLLALQESNPGIVVEWKHNKQLNCEIIILGRVFWAFGHAIEGSKSSRPIISIEGTYLYGRFSKKLLIAIAFDAYNEIFPLAYALAEEENNVN